MSSSIQSFREWAVAQGYNIGNPQTGTYKGECVSLVQQYLYQVFDIPYASRGHAKDFVPPTFSKITNGIPKSGDILRFQKGKGGAGKKGHIGLVDDDTKFLNQNHNKDHKVYRDSLPAGYELFRPTRSFTVKNQSSAPAKVKTYGYGYITKDALIGRVAAFLREKHPEFTPKAALGNYIGPNITGAIKAYQKLKGLKVDGRFATGGETLRALTADGFKG